MKKRLIYLGLMLSFGGLGFLIKTLSASLPLLIATYLPSILWACMVYFFVAAIVNIKPAAHFTMAIILTMAIEFSQMLNFDWLISLRGSTIGAYIFGVSFLLSDVISYAGAVLLCFIVDYLAYSKKPKTRPSKYRKDDDKAIK